MTITNNEWTAYEIGGERLVALFDLILVQQRKRWNAPDWRGQPVIDADLQNWKDVAWALDRLPAKRHYIASGQAGEAD